MNKTEETNAQKTLLLFIELSGCACTCSHCSAEGHPYPPMPLDNIERVLRGAARFCRSEGMKLQPHPYHDVLTRKDALRVMQMVKAYGADFVPFTTAAHTLGMRSDWEQILTGARELGTTTMWFAFHGLGEVHDRAVRRRGAFEKAVLAIERAKSAGFRCGANVFFSTKNLHQIVEINEFCRVKLDEICCEFAFYSPTPRLRAFEAIRPTLDQVAPYASMFTDAFNLTARVWADLDRHTESYYVRQVLAEQAPEILCPPPASDQIILVCRNNLDLHSSGYTVIYGPFHGNLGRGSMQACFRKAKEAGQLSNGELYFPGREIPPVQDLARNFGDSDSQKLHRNADSVVNLWIDRAMA